MSGLFVSSLDSSRLGYYFGGISSGKEDCRTGLGADEVSCFGSWSGLANQKLGLLDILGQLRGLPRDERFIHPVRNVGYDLCWVAPKQLSILFGTLPSELSVQLAESHHAAVTSVLKHMKEAMTYNVKGNLSAVGFVHRTSRSLDPHLHTHLLLANRIELEDGSFRAVNSAGIYRNVREWSLFYRRSLAKEVYSRLGIVMVERGLDDEGGPTEIPGFPADVSRLFSKRSSAVNELVERWGAYGPGASRTASLMTRDKKVLLSSEQLRERWANELERAGFTVRHMENLIPRRRLHLKSLPEPRSSRSVVDAAQHFGERAVGPSRGEGWLRIASFQDDIYQRVATFSLGEVVAVVTRSGVKRSELDKFDIQTTAHPKELVALGSLDFTKIAQLAFEYRHQDLILACEERSIRQCDAFRSLPVMSVAELSESLRSLHVEQTDPCGTEKLAISAASVEMLKRSIMAAAAQLKSWELGQDLPTQLVMPTRKDRDLARVELARTLGLETDGGGFYDSEPVWIHYLPKGQDLGDSRYGQIDLERQEIRYRHCGAIASIPIESIDLSRMISPVSVMSVSDAKRAFRSGFCIDLNLGEFASYNVRAKSAELFSSSRVRQMLRSRIREPRALQGAAEFFRGQTEEHLSNDNGFWRNR